jgi:tRNA threonylcarbamoyladenosine biosynthesis protein TsaE
VILLSGDLGAGKTRFVQGLAVGLGIVPETRVTSPTFVLHAEYSGRIRLNHLDLYRLNAAGGLDELGIWDLLGDGEATAAVEWPEILSGHIGTNRLEVEIVTTGDFRREFRIAAGGSRHAALLAAWLDNPHPDG